MVETWLRINLSMLLAAKEVHKVGEVEEERKCDGEDRSHSHTNHSLCTHTEGYHAVSLVLG